MRPWIPTVVVVALGAIGCMSGSEPSMDAASVGNGDAGYLRQGMAKEESDAAEPAAAAPMEMEPEMAEGATDDADGSAGGGERKKARAAPRPPADLEEAKGRADDGKDNRGEAPAEVRTRAWFPESFLWQPLVVTDNDGVATVDMTVPDQLTSWRILGLAHDRSGHQTGAVHSFDSRLPIYVDPVVPGWLYAGDVLQLPIQVVNTTDEPVSASLRAEASSALSGAGEVSIPIGAGDSNVVNVRISAVAAGTGVVSATLSAAAGSDRADRQIPVLPQGRPVQQSRGGSLSADRSFSIGAPAGADPTTQELTVQVFPGPLAALQAEVERLQSGAQPDDGAYGFALASQLSVLAERSGAEVEPRAIRALQMVAWQRIVRASRSPDAGVSSDLLASMGSVRDHELAMGLRPRLVRGVIDGQRGDGTWSRTGSGTLQQVLVQTAWAARALPPEEEGARLRASGALERYAPQIDDAYTAAVVLASGVASDGLEERLRELVLAAISEGTDGERSVAVPSGVLNPWGYRPTQAEMLAWTTLALLDQEQLPWRLDLAAALMSRYDARWGFGAGRADTIALEAIARGLPGISGDVQVVLSVGGVEVSRAKLDPTQPRVPATLVAETHGKVGEISLRAEPQVAGLAFVATLDSWVPWSGNESLPGVEVEVGLSPLSVGADGALRLTLSAPSNEVLTIEQGLPAGLLVDEASLAALAGRLERWEISTDRIRLVTRPFQAGEVMELAIPVQPAFAGNFGTPPLSLKARSGREVFLPPVAWVVSGAAGS